MSANRKQGERNQQQTNSSKTFPTMPARELEEIPDITIISDSQSSEADEVPSTVNADPELTATAEITYHNGNETKPTEVSPYNLTPTISSPVGCSTERTQRLTAKSSDTTPTASPQKASTSADKGIVDFSIEGGATEIIEGEKEIRRSNGLKTAKRVEIGGIEYF